MMEGESRANPGEIERGWTRSDSGPAEVGFSPVKTVELLVYDWNYSTRRRNAGICPGTPLILSHPEEVQRTRTELELTGLQLADYSYSYGGFASGIVIHK
jgi:hypothetical protein